MCHPEVPAGQPAPDVERVEVVIPLIGKQGEMPALMARPRMNAGAGVLVVALLWNEDNSETMGTAAALGCQVVGLHPGQDLSSALSRDIGAGSGRR